MRFTMPSLYDYASAYSPYNKVSGTISRNSPRLTQRTITITERRKVEVTENAKAQSELEKLFGKPATEQVTRKWYTENVAVMEETFE
jgi:hypothetical protein